MEKKDIKDTEQYWIGRMRDIIQTTPVMPDALREYIMELSKKLKEVCEDKKSIAICDGESEIALSAIEKTILAKRTRMIGILENNADFRSNNEVMAEKGAETLKRIAASIWDSDEIVRNLQAFMWAVKVYKSRFLAMKTDEEQNCFEDEMLKIESEISKKEGSLGKDVQRYM